MAGPNDNDMFDGAYEDEYERGWESNGSDKDIFGNRLDGEDVKVTDK